MSTASDSMTGSSPSTSSQNLFEDSRSVTVSMMCDSPVTASTATSVAHPRGTALETPGGAHGLRCVHMRRLF